MERGQVEAGGGTIKPTKFRLEDIDKARERDYHHVSNRNLYVLDLDNCPTLTDSVSDSKRHNLRMTRRVIGTVWFATHL